MSACRESKGLASFTAKLSRMVGNVKRKHKALAVQHAFVLDLFTAPAPPPPLSPFFSFFPSVHTNSSSTQSKTPQFASRTRSCSRSPLHPAAYSAPQTANSSPIRKILETPRSAPVSPQRIPHIDPHPQKTQPPSSPLHADPSSLSASASAVISCRCCGKLSGYDILWAAVLFAVLYAFFCMGKELACVVATAAHLSLQIMEGLGLLFTPYNSVKKDSMVGWIDGHTQPILKRSATISHSHGPTQCNRRSKSWTPQDDVEEGTVRPSVEVSKVVASSKPATTSGLGGGTLSGGMKLQLMLVFSLCGLFYGRFLAICIVVCCLFICSQMERHVSSKRELKVILSSKK